MRPVVCIHGVSEKKNARGFSGALHAEVTRQCQQLQLEAPAWAEVVWSDLMDIPGDAVTAPLDMLADVAAYEHSARKRRAIHKRLTSALAAAPGCILVAHSLGSVVALDVVALTLSNPLPHALVTMGSPLGIDSPALSFRWRAQWSSILSGRWLDVWSDADPIVTGRLCGVPIVQGCDGLQSAGYPCHSRQVDIGQTPAAHTAYWDSPQVAAWILELASSR